LKAIDVLLVIGLVTLTCLCVWRRNQNKQNQNKRVFLENQKESENFFLVLHFKPFLLISYLLSRIIIWRKRRKKDGWLFILLFLIIMIFWFVCLWFSSLTI